MNVSGDDISIMYSLFSYKIKNNGNNYVVGFPSSSLTKVLNTLEKNKINYINKYIKFKIYFNFMINKNRYKSK